MRVKLYYSNLFVAMGVLTVAFIGTSASLLESFAISLCAFVAANLLDHLYESREWNKRRGISFKLHNNSPKTERIEMDDLTDLITKSSEEDGSTDEGSTEEGLTEEEDDSTEKIASSRLPQIN